MSLQLLSLDESRKTTEDAKDVQEEAKRLSELADKQGGNVDYSGLERRKTIIYETENRTNDLLQRVKEANKTAHFAILNGTKALKEARNTLETLQVCNALWALQLILDVRLSKRAYIILSILSVKPD